MNRPDDGSEPEIHLGCDRAEAGRWTDAEGTQVLRLEELRSSVKDLDAKLAERVGISDANLGFYAGELDELVEALEMALAARETLDDPGRRVEFLTRRSLRTWETRVARGREALEEGGHVSLVERP